MSLGHYDNDFQAYNCSGRVSASVSIAYHNTMPKPPIFFQPVKGCERAMRTSLLRTVDALMVCFLTSNDAEHCLQWMINHPWAVTAVWKLNLLYLRTGNNRYCLSLDFRCLRKYSVWLASVSLIKDIIISIKTRHQPRKIHLTPKKINCYKGHNTQVLPLDVTL